jgi:hypothetical protein
MPLSSGRERRRATRWATTILASVLAPALWADARADEDGVAFWLSGQYAALGAVPPQPGWSVPTMLYYYSGRGRGSAFIPRDDALTFGTDSQLVELLLSPTYAPHTKVFGGQAALSLSLGAGGLGGGGGGEFGGGGGFGGGSFSDHFGGGGFRAGGGFGGFRR